MRSTYTVKEAQKILGIPLSAIRKFVGNGFVSPTRGSRREYRLSFHDLVVLRMAKALFDASLSPRRIGVCLKRLRKQLPETLPLAGLRISAMGKDVIVKERDARWRAEDGQYLLALDVSESHGAVSFSQPSASNDHTDWFERAFDLESLDPAQSMIAYQKAIEQDPSFAPAYANLGRLLHAAGRASEAETIYLEGDAACPDDPIVLFNFALLKEDQERNEEAIGLYKRALAADPAMGDAHYNLGLLYQSLRRQREALRHFSAFRKLSAGSNSTE
ncbi:MAG: tetratricopeptide repeat protein [Burkholderiales bacterium]|jgi:tetratricopeptide (TPR) repeat protein